MTLRGVLRDWKVALPEFGRLGFRHELEKNALNIAECRVMSGAMSNPDWLNPGEELSVTAEIATFVFNRQQLSFEYEAIATFSLHALARCLQRSSKRDATEVFADIAAVVSAHADVMRAGRN
jgi:hypothetical protein